MNAKITDLAKKIAAAHRQADQAADPSAVLGDTPVGWLTGVCGVDDDIHEMGTDDAEIAAALGQIEEIERLVCQHYAAAAPTGAL